MDIKGFVHKIIPEINSPLKVYDLFRGLGYPEDKVLDPTYKRKGNRSPQSTLRTQRKIIPETYERTVEYHS